MNRYTIAFSLLISQVQDVSAFVPVSMQQQRFISTTGSRPSTFMSYKDPSILSMEELQEIAERLGFETAESMSRKGLERIASSAKGSFEEYLGYVPGEEYEDEDEEDDDDEVAVPAAAATDEPKKRVFGAASYLEQIGSTAAEAVKEVIESNATTAEVQPPAAPKKKKKRVPPPKPLRRKSNWGSAADDRRKPVPIYMDLPEQGSPSGKPAGKQINKTKMSPSEMAASSQAQGINSSSYNAGDAARAAIRNSKHLKIEGKIEGASGYTPLPGSCLGANGVGNNDPSFSKKEALPETVQVQTADPTQSQEPVSYEGTVTPAPESVVPPAPTPTANVQGLNSSNYSPAAAAAAAVQHSSHLDIQGTIEAAPISYEPLPGSCLGATGVGNNDPSFSKKDLLPQTVNIQATDPSTMSMEEPGQPGVTMAQPAVASAPVNPYQQQPPVPQQQKYQQMHQEQPGVSMAQPHMHQQQPQHLQQQSVQPLPQQQPTNIGNLGVEASAPVLPKNDTFDPVERTQSAQLEAVLMSLKEERKKRQSLEDNILTLRANAMTKISTISSQLEQEKEKNRQLTEKIASGGDSALIQKQLEATTTKLDAVMEEFVEAKTTIAVLKAKLAAADSISEKAHNIDLTFDNFEDEVKASKNQNDNDSSKSGVNMSWGDEQPGDSKPKIEKLNKKASTVDNSESSTSSKKKATFEGTIEQAPMNFEPLPGSCLGNNGMGTNKVGNSIPFSNDPTPEIPDYPSSSKSGAPQWCNDEGEAVVKEDSSATKSKKDMTAEEKENVRVLAELYKAEIKEAEMNAENALKRGDEDGARAALKKKMNSQKLLDTLLERNV